MFPFRKLRLASWVRKGCNSFHISEVFCWHMRWHKNNRPCQFGSKWLIDLLQYFHRRMRHLWCRNARKAFSGKLPHFHPASFLVRLVRGEVICAKFWMCPERSYRAPKAAWSVWCFVGAQRHTPLLAYQSQERCRPSKVKTRHKMFHLTQTNISSSWL